MAKFLTLILVTLSVCLLIDAKPSQQHISELPSDIEADGSENQQQRQHQPKETNAALADDFDFNLSKSGLAKEVGSQFFSILCNLKVFFFL